MTQEPDPKPAKQPRPSSNPNLSPGISAADGAVAEMGGQGAGTSRKDEKKKGR